MTHRERVRRTFRFEPTDRVPYDLMEGSVWPELQEYFRAAHGLTEPQAVLEHLDTDFRWTGMVNERLEAQRRAEQQTPPDPAAALLHTKSIARGPLADAQTTAAIERHDWPDPADWAPGDYARERRRWPDHALVFAPGWWPLFWGSCEAFGVEPALTNVVAAPALFECAVRCIHERYLARLAGGLAAARGQCDVCWLGDDFASQESMFLSPEHWRRFIKPCLAEQVDLIRHHDLYVLYHSCGAVRPVLGDLIDIGVNGLLVFQTSARGMDAASIARDFGGRLVFYGGMDVQQLLSFGTADAVAATVRANVRSFAKCGGYVVANSHHRVATIDGRNIETMCRAARESRQTGE